MSTSPANSAARALASMSLPFPAASGEHGYTCKPALPDEPSIDREQRVMHVPLAASSESALVRAREVARLAWSDDRSRTLMEGACEQARLHLLMQGAGIALDDGFAEDVEHVSKRATAHAVAGERARAVERVLSQGFTVREARAIDSVMRRASTDAARAGAAATVRHLEVVGLASAAALSVLASGDKHDLNLSDEAARAAHAVIERERIEDERRAEEERKRREAEAERKAKEARERSERETAERRAREDAERKEREASEASATSEPSDSAGDGEASEGPGTGDTSDAERPATSSKPSDDAGSGDEGDDADDGEGAGDDEGGDPEHDEDEGADSDEDSDEHDDEGDSEDADDGEPVDGDSKPSEDADADGEPGEPGEDASASASADAGADSEPSGSTEDLHAEDDTYSAEHSRGGRRSEGSDDSLASREAREREERERIERARAEDAARAEADAQRAREIAVREQMAEDERRRAQERLREQRARASIVAAERAEAALARAAADAAREHATLIERLEVERNEHDERERAYKGDLALAAQMVEDGVAGIRRYGMQTRWCNMVTDTGCPMPVRIAKIEAPRRRWSSEGMYLRAPHRLFSDGAAFVQYGGGREGGSVLIDVSGSMSLTVETVERLVRAAPAVSVAIYASDGHSDGWLRVVARNGRMVAPEHLRFQGGGNGVDGPALRDWLAKQPHPRVWVCDGCVTGRGDQTGLALGDECVATVRRLGIARVGTPERALALFAKINPKSKRAQSR